MTYAVRSLPISRAPGLVSFAHRCLVCLATLFAGLFAGPLSAADAARVPFEIAAGEAGTTLKTFARQAKREIIFPVQSIGGVKTNPLRGNFTVREGLDRLLAGTGLTVFEDASAGGLVVQKQAVPNEPRAARSDRPDPAATAPSPGATGVVTGRVLNVTSGTFLNNARVAVEGTNHEAFTDQTGQYHLANVPAGEVRLIAAYTGLTHEIVQVTVAPGGTQQADFKLSREGVAILDTFVVAEQRETNAQAIAINEQRYAPNIKNVISTDEYGDIAEGSLGEFLKYIPGVNVDFLGFDTSVNVRGFPNGMTPFSVDGNEVASAASGNVSREFDAGSIVLSSISRVEVSKVPTPDQSANSLGGSINVITRSAFERDRAQLTYRIYALTNSKDMTLGKRATPSPWPQATPYRIGPAADFSWVVPISKTLGFTLGGQYSHRYNALDVLFPEWSPDTAGTRQGTAENPVLATYRISTSPQAMEKASGSATIDWKPVENGTLSLSFQYTEADNRNNHNRYFFRTATTAFAPAAYDETFVHSGPGRGSIDSSPVYLRRVDQSHYTALSYRHMGKEWKFDGAISYSRAANKFRDVDLGFFNSIVAVLPNVTVNFDDIEQDGRHAGPKNISATTAAGVRIDPFDANNYTLTTTGNNQRTAVDSRRNLRVNASRSLPTPFPTTIKGGISVQEQVRDHTGPRENWTFVGPDGVANSADDRVSNYDIINHKFSKEALPFGFPSAQWLDLHKMWALYEAHPEYFRSNEAAAINLERTASSKMTETVSAAYLRGDAKLAGGKLWLVGGVRFEHTKDEGLGVRNDLRATYQQDANGNLIRNSQGNLIRVTTDAVQLANLQYTERGVQVERDYHGYYPSLNATYNVQRDLLVRFGYAKTIGRPTFNSIIPGITITDPASSTQRITVRNTSLKPWTADNYDLSLEYYFNGNSLISLGAFRKNIADFFGATSEGATPELLAEWGLGDEFVGYEIVSMNNVGSARITGLEFNYRQSLTFLPHWARGLQLFVNATKLKLEGERTADFSNFVPGHFNWGLSLSRSRFTVRLNYSWSDLVRLGALTGAGVPLDVYNYKASKKIVDINFEYRLTRRLSLFGAVRNLLNEPESLLRFGPETPSYARVRQFQRPGALISAGVKGEF